MGVTDSGPFDNDQGAAFGRELDQVDPSQRLPLVQRALEECLNGATTDRDSIDKAQPRAIAAVAVVASYLQGGPFVGACDSPAFLEGPLWDDVPDELVRLALFVLDRIADSNTQWAELFNAEGVVEELRYGLTA